MPSVMFNGLPMSLMMMIPLSLNQKKETVEMMPLFIIDIMRMERVTQWSTPLLFVGHWSYVEYTLLPQTTRMLLRLAGWVLLQSFWAGCIAHKLAQPDQPHRTNQAGWALLVFISYSMRHEFCTYLI